MIVHCQFASYVHIENILWETDESNDSKESEEIKLRLTGFSNATLIIAHTLSQQFDSNESIKLGEVYYSAPECFRQTQGWEMYKSDMWAVGVITYILLTGSFPFFGSNITKVIENIKTKAHVDPTNINTKLSNSSKLFIEGLLEKHPMQRFSAIEALNHPWIKENHQNMDEYFSEQFMYALKALSNSMLPFFLFIFSLPHMIFHPQG